jgi:hypothetical protein
MIYRIGKDDLLSRFVTWNRYLKRKVRLIACGGTALTLIGAKDSTKDVDLIVPRVEEHRYLLKTFSDMGYKQVTEYGWSLQGDVFVFDIFSGSFVHTTELLESPLEESNHTLIKEFSSIYLGVLNDYDLIISKLFRGTGVDIDDCMALIAHRKGLIDLNRLGNRYRETASFSVAEEKMNRNLDLFLERVQGGGVQ